jgi:hypothetical protein
MLRSVPWASGPLNDCKYGQGHLSSKVRGEQCGKCSGAENTDGGDESGHLNVPSCCMRKTDLGLFQRCFASRQNGFLHETQGFNDESRLRES